MKIKKIATIPNMIITVSQFVHLWAGGNGCPVDVFA